MGKGTPWLPAAEVLREIPYRLMNYMNKVEDPREAIFRHIDPLSPVSILIIIFFKYHTTMLFFTVL